MTITTTQIKNKTNNKNNINDNKITATDQKLELMGYTKYYQKRRRYNKIKIEIEKKFISK